MGRTDLAGSQVGREDGFELVIVDLTGTSHVKDSESELVVGVGLLSVGPATNGLLVSTLDISSGDV